MEAKKSRDSFGSLLNEIERFFDKRDRNFDDFLEKYMKPIDIVEERQDDRRVDAKRVCLRKKVSKPKNLEYFKSLSYKLERKLIEKTGNYDKLRLKTESMETKSNNLKLAYEELQSEMKSLRNKLDELALSESRLREELMDSRRDFIEMENDLRRKITYHLRTISRLQLDIDRGVYIIRDQQEEIDELRYIRMTLERKLRYFEEERSIYGPVRDCLSSLIEDVSNNQNSEEGESGDERASNINQSDRDSYTDSFESLETSPTGCMQFVFTSAAPGA